MLNNDNININDEYAIQFTKDLCNANFKNKNLNVLCLNISSLNKHFEEFVNFIESINFCVEVIVLTEIWIYSSQNSNFNIKNYNLYVSNRDNNRSGGVAIYVHRSVNSNCILSKCENNNNYVLVDLYDLKLKILGVYRQPVYNTNIFVDSIEEIIDKNKNCIIAGDMNINLLNKNDVSVLNYQNMLNSQGFCVLNSITNEYATRISNTISTLLDHMISDMSSYKYTLLTAPTSLSDHHFLILNINMNKTIVDKQLVKTIIDYKEIEKSLSSSSLLANCSNLDEFQNILSSLVKNNTKHFKISNKAKVKKPWISNEVLNLMKNRDYYYHLMKKYPQNCLFQRNFAQYKA